MRHVILPAPCALALPGSAPLAKVRAALTDAKDIALASARLQLIQPIIEIEDGVRRLPREFASLTAFVEHLARTAPPFVRSRRRGDKPGQGVTPRQFQKWVERYRQAGFEALADPQYKNKGRSSLPEKACLVAWATYFGERLSKRQAYRAQLEEAARQGYQPGSYAAVCRFLNAQSRAVSIYAREGEKAFNDKCAPYIKRQAPPVMDTAIGDHMRHDVWTFNDLWDDRSGEAVRLTLTPFMDFGSRKVTGYCWCLEPSSHSISSALRMAVAPFGAWRHLYVDNGKDYRKIGRIGLSPQASGVCVRLGIKVVYCLPFNPQAKPIERFFGTLHQQFDALWKPFYCGRSPENRPEDCDEALRQHELYRRGKLDKSPLPAASFFVRLAAAWIEEYNNTPHSGLRDRTPNQVFDEAWPPEKRQPVDPRALDPLLWDRQRRRVSEGGAVRIFNARYEPADPASSGTLLLRIGEDVLVACDPYNLGEAVALNSDGHFLGALRAQALLAQGPTSHEDVRAGMRHKRQWKRAVRECIESVTNACREMGVPTRLQRLEERAGLAKTGTDDAVALAAPGARLALPARAALRPAPQFAEEFMEDFRKNGGGDAAEPGD